MTIRTEHIGKMLSAAYDLAAAVNGMDDDERLLSGSDVPGTHANRLPPPPHGCTTWMALDRAANLAEHAAAELRDEAERAKGHWPVV